jgi:hypothetical protein
MSAREKKIMRIAIKAPNREALTNLAKEFPLDLGGGGPRRLPDGTMGMEAYTSEEVLDKLKLAGAVFDIMEDATKVGKERQKEVGRGDRFAGGKKVPRGLGRKE